MKQNAMTNENKINEKTRDLKKITRIMKIHDKKARVLVKYSFDILIFKYLY